MKIGWGWKIAILYAGFMGLIITLVVASSRQHFDLVTKDYYGEEIAYQKVIDASKNQAALSSPFSVHANTKDVIIDFPAEFKDKPVFCDVQFYSPVDAEWDKNFKLTSDKSGISIPRNELRNTRYTIKINCTAEGKKYYQETEILLHI